MHSVEFVRQIRDPIHGWVRLTEEESRLIDSPFMQRLRFIKQLGYAFLVYPGATHSRFEHSLGAMHLADIWVRELISRIKTQGIRVVDNAGRQTRRILIGELEDLGEEVIIASARAAALIHDAGHLPYSHVYENMRALIEGVKELDESAYGKLIGLRKALHEFALYMNLERNWEVRPMLDSGNVRLDLVMELLGFREPSTIISRVLRDIISGPLDVDRLDYVLRDLYYTGASIGASISSLDVERILRSSTLWVKGDEVRIVFDEKSRVNIEGFFLARYNLYRHVYLHHKVVYFRIYANNIVERAAREHSAVEQYIRELARFVTGTLPSSELIKVSDYYFDYVLSMSEPRYRDLLLRRESPHKPLWKRIGQYLEVVGGLVEYWDRKVGDGDSCSYSGFIRELTTRCRCGEDSCLYDQPSFEIYGNKDIMLLAGNSVVSLSEASELIRTLMNSRERHLLYFYVPENRRSECVEVARQVASELARRCSNGYISTGLP